MKGKVKRWVGSRGYGFIEAAKGGEDILVYHSDIGDLFELKEGQTVEFDVENQPRPRARNVKVIG